MSQASTTINLSNTENQSGRSLWADAFRRIRRDKIAVICFGIITVYALIAIASPMVFSEWKNNFDYENTNADPTWDEPLGTDGLGRSILQKTMLGASTSMTVGFMANAISIPIGMILGAIAGYYGRFLDDIIVWLYTTLSAIPGIIRLLAIKFAFVGVVLFKDTFFQIDLNGTAGIYIALGIMSWIGTCRLVRAETMKLRNLDYIVAAKAAGRGRPAILFRHIMPNLLHLGIINFSLGFVGAISAEVFLSFLNIGVKDRPSWGQMINSANMDLIFGRWYELVAAVGAMFIIILAWNIFGDRLRDALDPKLRNV